MSERPIEEQATATSKRKSNRSGAGYPRKRALIACEACRRRKVKCDNARPACGACLDLETECVYADVKTKECTYDLASLEILDRINYVARLLENQRDSSYVLHAQDELPVTSPETTVRGQVYQDFGAYVSPGSQPWSELSRSGQDDAEILLESLQIAGRNPQVSEDILNWPVFGTGFDRSKIEHLIFNPNHAAQTDHRRPSSHSIVSDPVRVIDPGKGISEDDVLHLMNKFLINVYIKNPILDPADLMRKARAVAEHGFAWDATSCLVLIVCALANISSTFSSECVTPQLAAGITTSIADTPDYATAEDYYVAAQKRICLLETSIPATQCFFLTGVYEMYSLRPVRAWASFNRACQTLQIYLRGRPQQDETGVERRLYWSCLKSECEIRMEINLPSSGLAKVNDLEAFPTPPPRETIASRNELSTGPVRYFESDVEQIWKYYLSEIAVRRIGNRLMNCFYTHDDCHTAWLSMPLEKMMRVADELELQLTQWFDNLPTTLITAANEGISEPHNKSITEELQFVLHARLYDFRERIYRPFLYLAIHHHYSENDPVQYTLAPYVQRCVDACLTILMRGTPRHRHHGTWYENRGMFLKSLLVLAAVKSGKIHVPELWYQGVQFCIAGFRFWEREAPDLREARGVLEGLLGDLNLV